MSILGNLVSEVYKFVELEVSRYYSDDARDLCDIIALESISADGVREICSVYAVDSGISQIYCRGIALGLINTVVVSSRRRPYNIILVTAHLGDQLSRYARCVELEALANIADQKRSLAFVDGPISPLLKESEHCTNVRRALSKLLSSGVTVLAYVKSSQHRYYVSNVAQERLLVYYCMLRRRLSERDFESVMIARPKLLADGLYVTYVQYLPSASPIAVEVATSSSKIDDVMRDVVRLTYPLCSTSTCTGYPIVLYIADRLSKVSKSMVDFVVHALSKLTSSTAHHGVYSMPLSSSSPRSFVIRETTV